MNPQKSHQPNSEDWTKPLISIFNSAWSDDPVHAKSIGEILDEIRSDDYKQSVLKLRKLIETGREKAYQEEKKKLPAVSLSGYCQTRSKDVRIEEKLISHSGILQVDIDSKDNPGRVDADSLQEWRERFMQDTKIAFGFCSPSGKGLKLGCRIPASLALHKSSFATVERYFLDEYGLTIDRSTKDPLRLCFFSWDPELWINQDAEVFEVADNVPAFKPRHQSPVPLETTASDIREMLSYIKGRPAYDDWIRIASAVWSAVPLDVGFSLLQEWMPEEKPGEYTIKHRSRLEEIGIGTLVYYASLWGFDARAAAKRKMWAGKILITGKKRVETPGDIYPEDPTSEIGKFELDLELIRTCYERGQQGDGELFAKTIRGRRKYDHNAMMWRIYKEGTWGRDWIGNTTLEFGNVIAEAYGRMIDHIIDSNKDADDEQKKSASKEISRIRSRIDKVRTLGYAEGCLKYASKLEGCETPDFNRNLYLLGVANGVIDFASMEFLPPSPHYMLTNAAPVNYDDQAECPRFLEFLNLFHAGDQEMISYIARIMGYSLTGLTDLDLLFFCYGSGANGKSTFIKVLQMLLGSDLMTTVSISALLESRSDTNFDYKKAMMEGMRIVVTDEIPEGKRLNESNIKSLVGGDSILARRPYEKPYNFEPTHKLWLIGNHKPAITGTDHGIWRRIHLIPWEVTISEDQKRPRDEVMRELQQELSGILNFAIAGYIDLVDNGLNPPAKVMESTREYRKDQDPFQQFFDERLLIDSSSEVEPSDVLQAYNAWVEDNNYPPNRKMSSKGVTESLKKMGFLRLERHGRRAFFEGLKMVEVS